MLTEKEFMKAVTDKEIDRRMLTPVQQERLGKAIRDSIQQLTAAVGTLGPVLVTHNSRPALDQLVAAVANLVQVNEKLLNQPTHPPVTKWDFQVNRNKGGNIQSIEATCERDHLT